MNKQVKIGLISFTITLVVLLGGYQGYQHWFIKRPVNQLLENQNGLSIKNIEFSPNRTELTLLLSKNYQFLEHFPTIATQLNEILGEGKWSISFVHSASAVLYNGWNEMLFGIREGIESKRYTLIRDTVEQFAKKYRLSYQLKMDERNLYLVLQHNNQIWYHLLPLKVVE